MNHTPENPPPPSDLWSEWLLRKRFAGDARYEQVVRGLIEQARDRVLDGAKLAAGMTLVDVGAGDGLIAFGALARTDPSLQAILTDVSAPLLAYAEKCAV
jgi:ubiquinone/menaquinone biosynthesis C-methylase UbiE